LPAGRDPRRSPRSNAVREGGSRLQQRRGLGTVGQDAGGESARRVPRAHGGSAGPRERIERGRGTDVGHPQFVVAHLFTVGRFLITVSTHLNLPKVSSK